MPAVSLSLLAYILSEEYTLTISKGSKIANSTACYRLSCRSASALNQLHGLLEDISLPCFVDLTYYYFATMRGAEIFDVCVRVWVCVCVYVCLSVCQNVPLPKRPTVKKSHSQNVPSQNIPFWNKTSPLVKRPKSKRTNANDLMQWLHSVTDCAVVIYADRDSKYKKFLRSRKSRFFSKFNKVGFWNFWNS